jgi:hypothetical protein
MPDRNKAAEAARLSRRSMLMGAAGAGAAGVAAATLGSAVLPALAAGAGPAAAGPRAGRQQAGSQQAGPAQADDLSAADLAEPVVVHVRDAARGELEVFRGTTATRLQDRDLAARLVRASTS